MLTSSSFVIAAALCLAGLHGCFGQIGPMLCSSTLTKDGEKTTDCLGRFFGNSLTSAIIVTSIPLDTQRLILTENNLDECRVERGIFHLFPNLRELDLSNNRLGAIDLQEIVQDVPSLQVLRLGQNHISTLSNDQNNCSSTAVVNEREPRRNHDQVNNNLIALYLRNNSLNEDDLHIFQALHLNNLTTLDLSENQIRTFNRAQLLGLAQVRELFLGDNRIIEASFTNLPAVEELNLHGNQLTSLNTLDLPSLIHLDLSNNRISIIRTGVFTNASRIRYLQLQGNRLGDFQIEGTFAGLSLLISLELSYNRIRRLPSGYLRGLDQLRQLHLDHNSITELDGGLLKPIRQLRFLSLEGNRLTSFGVLQALDNLEVIRLGGNRIGAIEDDSFIRMNNLRSIDLAGNLLQRVPIALNNPLFQKDSLVNISLADNVIREIAEGDFGALRTSIENLHLEGNMIGSVHLQSFHQLESLRVLTLHRNYLSSLPEGFLGPLWQAGPGLSSPRVRISLYDNPWYCNCSLQQIVDYQERAAGTIGNLNANATCDFDQVGSGTSALTISQWGQFLAGSCTGGRIDTGKAHLNNTTLLVIIVVLSVALVALLLAIVVCRVIKRCNGGEGFSPNDPPRAGGGAAFRPAYARKESEHTYDAAAVANSVSYSNIQEDGSSSLYYSQPYAHIDQQVILQLGHTDGPNYVNIKGPKP